jgi:hypothetical protein
MPHIKRIKREHEDRLLRKANTVSVGVGFKRRGGSFTNEMAIVVGVTKKKPADQLDPDDLVPPTIEGIQTDVIQTGGYRKQVVVPSANYVTERFRPAPAGVSCGHFRITAGTLGLWVGRVNDRGGLYILSNNHVLADENKASPGDIIYQPGPYDGGTMSDAIARLTAYVPLRFDGSANTADCAIAKVENPDLADQIVKGLPPVAGLFNGEVDVNLDVQKMGRTTGLTSGFVAQTDLTVRVGYNSGVATFRDQISVWPGGFSAPGDSGSSVWTKDMELIGLLFAGSDVDTVVCPLGHVFSNLGLYLKTA